VHVPALLDRPGAQLVDELDEAGDGGFEENAALLGGGLVGVAVDARLRPAAPEVVEADGVAARAFACPRAGRGMGISLPGLD